MGLFQSTVLRTIKRNIKEMSGGKIPFIAGHKLLYTCNLRCHMCPSWRRSDQALLSVDEERKMMDDLADFGVSYMGFEGGEPSLRKDLPEILRLSHDRFFTSVVSNEWMLKDRYKEVSEYIDHLFVSIDRVGEVHATLRGGGRIVRKNEAGNCRCQLRDKTYH
ncbi:MAG: radical SAM protein [Thermoplasmatales archaeon]